MGDASRVEELETKNKTLIVRVENRDNEIGRLRAELDTRDAADAAIDTTVVQPLRGLIRELADAIPSQLADEPSWWRDLRWRAAEAGGKR